jgi:hypothetical protein
MIYGMLFCSFEDYFVPKPEESRSSSVELNLEIILKKG